MFHRLPSFSARVSFFDCLYGGCVSLSLALVVQCPALLTRLSSRLGGAQGNPCNPGQKNLRYASKSICPGDAGLGRLVKVLEGAKGWTSLGATTVVKSGRMTSRIRITTIRGKIALIGGLPE